MCRNASRKHVFVLPISHSATKLQKSADTCISRSQKQHFLKRCLLYKYFKSPAHVMRVCRDSYSNVVFQYSSQRYEKKFGRDENAGIPRCIMAAKFRTDQDPTGEKILAHWISVG